MISYVDAEKKIFEKMTKEEEERNIKAEEKKQKLMEM